VNCDNTLIPMLLTVAEVQKLLRLGRGKTYALIRANKIPSIRLGGAIRIPRDALLHMLQEIPSPVANLHLVPWAEKEGKSCEGM
jgi:excisionase family DNA binding protein